MNLPNKLTLTRILITPVFVLILSVPFTGNYTLALVLFLLAMVTDHLDGTIARARRQETDMGKLLDPLADKILISSALICFVALPEIHLPAWMVIVIVSREFAITGLRLMAAGRGVIIPAGRWGKNKTISQVATIVAILLYLCLFYDSRVHLDFRPLLIVMLWVTVGLTLFSGSYYVVRNWKLISSENMDLSGPAGRVKDDA